MSLSSSRPRVRSVSGAAAAAGVATGGVAIGALIRACVNALNGDERHAVEGRLPAADDRIQTIPAPAVVANHFSVAERPALAETASMDLPASAAVRASTLMALASTKAVVNAEVVRQPLERLMAAATPFEAASARASLVGAVQASHRQMFVSSLTAACVDASRQIGMNAVETSVTADGTVRVVASSDSGRALVTEITPAVDGEVAMASEVIGGDGRCSELMDQFDRALEQYGVSSDTPKRKNTGGVCDLAAARAFVRRPGIRRAATTVSPAQPTDPERRPRSRSRRNTVKR